MNETLLWSLVIAALALAIIGRARYSARKRKERFQAEGYSLISALKAYSAWVDYQRDEPLSETGELASPEPLARARAIKDASFPGLSQHMLRLLQAHGRLVEYLWRHDMLRRAQASAWRPAWQDPQYQQIRGAQDDLIEEMIDLCQETIGDRAREWRRTGTDFAFSGGAGVSSTQDPAASA